MVTEGLICLLGTLESRDLHHQAFQICNTHLVYILCGSEDPLLSFPIKEKGASPFDLTSGCVPAEFQIAAASLSPLCLFS